MNMNVLTALLALAIIVYMLYKQFVRRPVTQRDLLLPVLGGLCLGAAYLTSAPDGSAQMAVPLVLGSAALGIGSGLASGLVVRVWREAATGVVYQRGGWLYLGVLLGLVTLRLVGRLALGAAGFAPDLVTLNDAFIAMAIGNFLGRAINVSLRALALVGWDFAALPRRRALR